MKASRSKCDILQKSDFQFWGDIKKGDTTALGNLYDMYIDSLFSYGIQHSQNKEYVMDCIHDLFLELYKYRGKLADTDNVKYYLFASLKRKINKKYRQKIITISNEDMLFDKSIQKRYTASIESEIIENEQVVERNLKLASAMAKLTKKQKKGLFLRFNQGQPYEEIAEIMGVSIDSARTTIYRALMVLRKHSLSIVLLSQFIFF